MKTTFAYCVIATVALAGCGGNDGGKPTLTPTLDRVAINKACAMAMSCVGVPQFPSGSSCAAQVEVGIASGAGILGASAADLTRLLGCATASNDCASVIACFTQQHASDYCAAHNEYSCDGDTLIGCINGNGLEQNDCTKFGMHCVEANSSATCSDGKSCDPTAASRCDGNVFVNCDSDTSLESKADCGVAIPNGVCDATLGCTPPLGGACTANGCSSGDSIASGFVCYGGRQLPIDCGAFNDVCDPTLTTEGSPCVAPGSQCDGTSDVCTPDRSTLQICVSGQWMSTTCSSIGLTTCGSSNGIVSCS